MHVTKFGVNMIVHSWICIVKKKIKIWSNIQRCYYTHALALWLCLHRHKKLSPNTAQPLARQGHSSTHKHADTAPMPPTQLFLRSYLVCTGLVFQDGIPTRPHCNTGWCRNMTTERNTKIRHAWFFSFSLSSPQCIFSRANMRNIKLCKSKHKLQLSWQFTAKRTAWQIRLGPQEETPDFTPFVTALTAVYHRTSKLHMPRAKPKCKTRAALDSIHWDSPFLALILP